MDANEVKELIEQVIKQNNYTLLLYIIISVIIGVVISFGISYIQKKGQNIATKQDIEDITRKTEIVRIKAEKNLMIINHKYALKYGAILKSLTLIDCYFSCILSDNGKNLQKQYSTIEDARKCHNELILTCENEEILKLFSIIMSKSSDIPPTDLLNSYRNLCRKELGFGSEIHLDRDIAWFASITFTNQET